MLILEKLSAFRSKLKDNNIDAYIIPSSDPHQSEYAADHWNARAWISNFDGSAGTVVISQDHAGLWTDSRYFLQAEEQLSGTTIQLHKVKNYLSPTHIDWLCENMKAGQTVGIDGWMFSKNQEISLRKKLSTKNIKLITHIDLVSQVWKERPTLPKHKAFEHKVAYAGKSYAEKQREIVNHLEENNADYLLLTALDEIAWMINIRSSDVVYNPVCISYLLVGKEQSELFIDAEKVTDLAQYFENNNINIHPYESISAFLEEKSTSQNIIVDKSCCNVSLYDTIDSDSVIHQDSIVKNLKAIKNEVEITNLRKALIKDGVALANAFHWLDQHIDNNDISEYDFAQKIASCRAEQALYFGESFGAIVGYNGNGAIIHYSPSKDGSAILKREGILLCDSGGQYQDGTTDITRTFAFSTPTEEQKVAYTSVLMGHIDLDQTKFPYGTTGGQLDTLARHHLWNNGLNYLHGTGHGVGFFLNVHEPPQGFAAGPSTRSNTILKTGMITSNEPGYYKDHEFGIRIENLFLTRDSKFDDFLEHETLTLYPIDKKLINKSLLSQKHIDWLNEYHQLVWETLSPLLNPEVKEWIKPQCAPF